MLGMGGRSVVGKYPVMRLHEAGLLAGQDESVLSDLYPVWRPKQLTYQGHELLETVRDTQVWPA
jgi:hypothetical protein